MERHTFLAISIPTPIQKKLYDYTMQVKEGLPLKRWTSQGDFHITLEFLGETSDHHLKAILTQLEGKLKCHEPFSLTLIDQGIFGNPKTPRVFWIGVNKPEQLILLQKDTAQACKEVGFKNIDNRPYRPHVTIGKHWGGKPKESVIPSQAPDITQLLGCNWRVEEIILYEVQPNKPQKYVPLKRFKLGENIR